MNYNIRLQNSSSTSGLQDSGKSNSKTGSITNVSNAEGNPLLEQSLSLNKEINKELEKLRQQQELEKQHLLKKLEQQQQQQQQHLLEQHKERIRAIQTKDFSNKIIEEEHRPDDHAKDAKPEKEPETNLSSNSIASLEVRKRLKDKIKLKQNGAIAGGQPQPGVNSPANWSTRFKYNEDLIPLKKAASEPNLKVKSALKQKVMHRRCSPLLKRKQKRFGKGPMHLVQSGDSNTHSAPVSASSSSKFFLIQKFWVLLGCCLLIMITVSNALSPSSVESSTPPNSKPESIPGSPPAFVCGSITTGNSASSTPQYNVR